MSIAAQFKPVGQAFDDLYGFLAEAREREPIFFSDEHQAWVLTRYEDIVRVLKDNETFTVENVLQAIQHGRYDPRATAALARGVDWNRTKHIMADDSPDHARFRNAIQSVLTPRRLRMLEPGVRSIIVRLIERMRPHGECDLVDAFSYPVPILTIFLLIGFSEAEEELDRMRVWSDDMFRLFFTPLTPEEQIRCAEHSVLFQDYMRAKIRARIEQPADDLISEMLAGIATGALDLSEDEMVLMFTMTFIGAGHETTKSAISSSVYHLLRNDDAWQHIVQQPLDIPTVVEECLRFDTPVLAWYRVLTRDMLFGGHAMKAGDRIVLTLGSANHDAARFEQPDSLCPMRAHGASGPIRHLTFSMGKHFCIGAPLARMELRLALEELSCRLPNLRLKRDQHLVYDASFVGRGLSRLDLEWDPA